MQVRAQGIVEPAESTRVLSRASGQITRVLVHPGDLVQQGQLLVTVDARTAQATLDQAQANLAADSVALTTAQDNEEREADLKAIQGATEAEYDSVALIEATAQASTVRDAALLDNARFQMENTEVRAPAAGVVLAVDVNQGTIIPSAVSSVGATVPLLTIGRLDTVEVVGPVGEYDIGKVSEGMQALVAVDAYPGTPFAGQVTNVEPQSIRQNNETMFPVHVRLANPGRQLRPGMHADLAIEVGESRDALAIPMGALRQHDDLETAAAMLGLPLSDIEQDAGLGRERPAWRTGVDGRRRAAEPELATGREFGGAYVVFVQRGGKPHAVAVKTGIDDGDYAALVSGDLHVGDTILVLPSSSLVRSEARFASRLKRFTSLPGTRR